MELFGFDPELPLAKDMKARGVKAIVMEVRFSQVRSLVSIHVLCVDFVRPEFPVRSAVLPRNLSSVRPISVVVVDCMAYIIPVSRSGSCHS